jgi:hypothetical protein
MRPIAERHGITMLQLACLWNLGQPAVRCVAPTLIQEAGPNARPIEDKRAELAAVTELAGRLSEQELAALAEIGDNRGSMTLKGASAEHEGPPAPDRWALDAEDSALAIRLGIDPRGDLGRVALAGANH